ncbi:hypothetical protein [Clostridium estertheticum]|nr:hypothetical protein [Clostridium estertheticum]
MNNQVKKEYGYTKLIFKLLASTKKDMHLVQKNKEGGNNGQVLN